MVKTTVYLDPETAMSLRQLASEKGCSQAELIREALAIYTSHARRPLPQAIGRYRSGRSDVSRRAKELFQQAIQDKQCP